MFAGCGSIGRRDAVGDLRPAKELEREDACARVRPVDARDADVRVPGEVAMEGVGVPPLEPVVELLADRAGELVDDLAHVHEVEGPHALLRDASGLVEEAEVGFDLLGRAGALDLDRDDMPVREHGSVHLADRRGGQRLAVELEEEALDREAEVFEDDALDLLVWERPHVVLEAAELGDDVRRQDVRAHREQLAELDERRPELVEHLAQVTPPLGRRRLRVECRLRPRPGQQVGQLVGLEPVAEPVPDRHLRDLGHAAEAALRGLRHAVSVTPCRVGRSPLFFRV